MIRMKVRPKVSVCSTHKVACRKRVWSHQVYNKVMALKGTLAIEEADCPYCGSLMRQIMRELARERIGA